MHGLEGTLMHRLLRILRMCGLGVLLAIAFVSAGPAAADDTPAEAANRQVVLDFYAALNAAESTGTLGERIQAIAEQYLSPDYVQRAGDFVNLPGPGSARDRLVRMFQSMPPRPQTGPSDQTTIAVMAEGDLVMLLTTRTMPDPAGGPPKLTYIFNMFRVSGGKLVEHWDVSPARPGFGGPPPGAGAPPA